MINVRKLSKELKAAGILFGGCNADGVVWDTDGVTEIQNRKEVIAVLAVHDPTPEPNVDLFTELEKRIEALEKR